MHNKQRYVMPVTHTLLLHLIVSWIWLKLNYRFRDFMKKKWWSTAVQRQRVTSRHPRTGSGQARWRTRGSVCALGPVDPQNVRHSSVGSFHHTSSSHKESAAYRRSDPVYRPHTHVHRQSMGKRLIRDSDAGQRDARGLMALMLPDGRLEWKNRQLFGPRACWWQCYDCMKKMCQWINNIVNTKYSFQSYHH